MIPQDRLIVSTACLKGDKTHDRVLDVLIGLGIKNIELTGVHPYMETPMLRETVLKYKNQGIGFTFHNYFPPPKDTMVLNFLSRDAQTKRQATDLISEAVELAKQTQVSIYAFHPGYYRDAQALPNGHFKFNDEIPMAKQTAMQLYKSEFPEFYKKLNIQSDNQKVFVALENLFPGADGINDSFMCTFEEIDELFQSEGFRDTNIGLLIDLGHLTISANILGFDREESLLKIIKKYGDRIFEVHLSENDGREDLHYRVHRDSWQLKALRHFKNTGARIGGTRICIESRGLTEEEIGHDYEMVLSTLKEIGV